MEEQMLDDLKRYIKDKEYCRCPDVPFAESILYQIYCYGGDRTVELSTYFGKRLEPLVKELAK